MCWGERSPPQSVMGSLAQVGAGRPLPGSPSRGAQTPTSAGEAVAGGSHALSRPDHRVLYSQLRGAVLSSWCRPRWG